MAIDIIGTGAIGLLFASKLKLASIDTSLWCRLESTAKLLQSNGIDFISKEGLVEQQLHFPCFTFGQAVHDLKQKIEHKNDATTEVNYALIAVKQIHINEPFIQQLCEQIRMKQYSAVVLIQNGIGHVHQLAEHIHIPIITAVTSEAARRSGYTSIEHTGHGQTILGDELGRDQTTKHQRNIENMLLLAGFNVFVSNNIKEYIYKKLVINCVINPLTAIFDVSNGELPQHKQRYILMKALYDECISILAEEEHSLHNMSFDHILDVCNATYNNTSSMRADILRGLATEINNINGAVVNIACKRNLKAPLNESMTRMIEALHPIV